MINKNTNGETQSNNENEPIQDDLFTCEIANWPVKDDLASMEIPLFSLTKGKDTEIRQFKRGSLTVRVIPSGVGAATVFDKDLLIFAMSQIIAAKNQGLPISKTVKIDSYEFLKGTDRGDGRNSFESILGMLRRLRGTTIETNIPTGNVIQTDGFSLIEPYKILSEKKRKDPKTGEDISRVLSFTLTFSDWLWNGMMNFEVLTLNKGYFNLPKPIERRLYEIARKHCGDKPYWKINIDLLAEKVGTTRPRYKFRDDLREVIKSDLLPDYRVALDTNKSPDDVVFYTKDSAKLARALINSNHDAISWFESLLKKDARGLM
ncbi:replication initiator protein A [Chromobacterium vaccinii]|uniref:replication initiator protein A n=1 Tax=Chromobacterium vaccinii TaxID=1108595 RepID=UPI003458F473